MRLFAIIAILTAGLITSKIYAQEKIDVTSKEVNSMVQKDNRFVVLDVRTPGEFSQGHIKGAVNIDINQPDALEKIGKLDKNATYIVYCRTKNRSGVAVNYMMKNDFSKIFHMTDGMVGWNQSKLPVER